MKSTKIITLSLAFFAVLIVSSCSKQMYGYRQKINVEPSALAKVKTELPTQEIASKTTTNIDLSAAIASVNVTEMAPVINQVQSLVPQQGSKASAKRGFVTINSAKKQLKAMAAEIRKSKKDIHVEPKRWMIVGLILVLAAWIVGIITGLGGIIGIIYLAGAIVFTVGLVYFLLDYLNA